MDEKELLSKIKYLIKKRGSLRVITEELGLEEYQVLGLIELLKNDGLNVVIRGDDCCFAKIPLTTEQELTIPIKDDELKILHLSDTHLASKYDNVPALHRLYEIADKENADFVLHSGDMVDGRYPTRQGNEYELKEISYQGQRDYVIDKYPRIGKKTYFIAGNHDVTWYKLVGVEIGKDIAEKREDLVYLGQDVADLKIGKLRIRLFHGKSGQTYARSYMIQKYLDNMKEKPDILQTGHVHYALYMQYLNTHALQTASLQRETPYSRSKGLACDNSAWLCTYELNKGKIVTVTPKLLTLARK